MYLVRFYDYGSLGSALESTETYETLEGAKLAKDRFIQAGCRAGGARDGMRHPNGGFVRREVIIIERQKPRGEAKEAQP